MMSALLADSVPKARMRTPASTPGINSDTLEAISRPYADTTGAVEGDGSGDLGRTISEADILVALGHQRPGAAASAAAQLPAKYARASLCTDASATAGAAARNASSVCVFSDVVLSSGVVAGGGDTSDHAFGAHGASASLLTRQHAVRVPTPAADAESAGGASLISGLVSPGAVAGIVIGAVVGVALAVTAAIALARRRRCAAPKPLFKASVLKRKGGVLSGSGSGSSPRSSGSHVNGGGIASLAAKGGGSRAGTPRNQAATSPRIAARAVSSAGASAAGGTSGAGSSAVLCKSETGAAADLSMVLQASLV